MYTEGLFTLTNEGITENCNIALDAYLSALKKETVITEEQYKVFMEYRIVVVEPKGLGTVWDKFWKRETLKITRFEIVKVI